MLFPLVLFAVAFLILIVFYGLEAEARRRAVVGVKKPIYYKGAVIDHVRGEDDETRTNAVE